MRFPADSVQDRAPVNFEPADPLGGHSSNCEYDVSDDGAVTPLDTLLVIRALNDASALGQGFTAVTRSNLLPALLHGPRRLK
jgi:hypothetical protein